VTPYKIEINLHKRKEGLKWATLEGDAHLEEEPKPVEATKLGESHKDVVGQKEKLEKAPIYPTSSRKGPKDWDKLASDALKAEKAKGGEKDAGLGDDDDDDEADPMNGFFKKLYKDADPDTRRAMMKSYQESNGTALSTNWADVSKGPVETHPPEGLVAKKWGE
jgi:suppressor of G2 allele of SKP1